VQVISYGFLWIYYKILSFEIICLWVKVLNTSTFFGSLSLAKTSSRMFSCDKVKISMVKAVSSKIIDVKKERAK